MKKNFLIVLICFFCICCNNSSDEPESREDTATVVYTWDAVLNDSGRLEVHKIAQGGPDSISVPSVIGFLNKMQPNVQLQFIKISGDTLYVSVPEATYLTQQMGSSGPQEYFARAVYNLTEIPGIRYVNFDFEPGDHASPDVLSRDNFKSE